MIIFHFSFDSRQGVAAGVSLPNDVTLTPVDDAMDCGEHPQISQQDFGQISQQQCKQICQQNFDELDEAKISQNVELSLGSSLASFQNAKHQTQGSYKISCLGLIIDVTQLKRGRGVEDWPLS